jgi:hypothetical protein
MYFIKFFFKFRNSLTWIPKIANIKKNAQLIRIILPIGLREESNVVTTSFNPGSLFIIRNGLNVLNILSILNILLLLLDNKVIMKSIIDIITKRKSIIFHPFFK